ncbi:MAG: GPW/gp25 family protein [Acidobacteria bacterium]|nr:GPW/gp25 family protein [Acidobacteriota bacterium]
MKSLLGTSVAFPFRPNGRGGLALSVGEEAVNDSIKAIIESLRGSHLMEPWLGLPSWIFKPIEDAQAIAYVIRQALVDGDDRIDPARIEVEADIGDDGLLKVAVTYAIRGDFSTRTLQTGFRLLG